MTVKFFIIASIALFIALLSGKLFFYTHENRFVREKSVTISTFVLIFYILSALIAVFFVQNYEKLSLYTLLQLAVIAIGILVVI